MVKAQVNIGQYKYRLQVQSFPQNTRLQTCNINFKKNQALVKQSKVSNLRNVKLKAQAVETEQKQEQAEPKIKDEQKDTGILDGVILQNGVVDYYALLGVDDNATGPEIKNAYRYLAKIFHPDKMGDSGHNVSVLLNEAYTTLVEQDSRRIYNELLQESLIVDEDADYTGKTLSVWSPTQDIPNAKNTDPNETRAVFVDECSCIGCTNCVWCAESTFYMEDNFGRSRVKAQWADTEDDLKAAVQSCPVDCIHWVDKEQLPALEYLMQIKNADRTDVGVMQSGQDGTGITQEDVFSQAKRWARNREERKRIQELRAKYAKIQKQAKQKAKDMYDQKDRVKQDGILGHIQRFYDILLSSFSFAEKNLFENVYGKADEKEVGSRKRQGQDYKDMGTLKRSQTMKIPQDLSLVNQAQFQQDYSYMSSILEQIAQQQNIHAALLESQSEIQQQRHKKKMTQ